MALLYLGAHPFERIVGDYSIRNFTLAERCLTQLRVVVFYVSLLIFPHPSRLNLDHDFLLSHSFIDPVSTLFCALILAGLNILAICIAKKERLVSFCIIWFFGNLLIESSVIGLEIIFEQRIYLPSMLICLVPVTLIYRYVHRGWLKVEILCMAILVFSTWTYARNSVWKSEVSLWNDCVEKSPEKSRPHVGLGLALMHRGNYRGAVHHYYQALKINPDDSWAHNNLGNALSSQGRIKESIRHYSKALSINPGDPLAHNNIGVALAKLNRTQAAVRHFSKALRIDPNYIEAYNNWGNALLAKNRIEAAVSLYKNALQINSEDAASHNNLGVALARLGKSRDAVQHFSEALRINPGYSEAFRNLEFSLKKSVNPDDEYR